MPVTTGAMLSKIADGWIQLLNPFPWGEGVAEGLRRRGRYLFAVGSRILGHDRGATEPAGELWALADGATHCSDPDSRAFLFGEARAAIAEVPSKIPKDLRPLTVIAALAAADVLGKRAAGRATAALRHRLFGTIPRS